MIYLPIIGASLEAIGSIIDKKIVSNKKINVKNYSVYGFLALVIVMLIMWVLLPLVNIFIPEFKFWQLWPNYNNIDKIIIFIAIVITSVFANLLMIYALKREDLTVLEPIRLMQPLFTIIIAFTLSFFLIEYSKENNPLLLILAFIACLTLIISHIKKHHFDFDKFILAALLGNFLFGLELALSPLLLPQFTNFYSSISFSFTFYLLRCFFIFFICLLIFRPKPNSFPKKEIIPTLIVSTIWVIFRIILYLGYSTYGVVKTTILLSVLAPIFIYILARIFLKEKLELRNIISAVIIVICVVVASIIQK
ncbi:MAG: EamA family transporter [Candidatus Pacearchaeota archaeon]|jgi:drug/metabolite transporter (DMT)-like permease